MPAAPQVDHAAGSKRRREIHWKAQIEKQTESDGHIAPAAILAALAERGFRRILVEGGANTVSRFLEARCLDRLHVVIAPIIIGAGPSSVTLPPIARVEHALRAPIRAHVLGDELLVDCDLSGQRLPLPFPPPQAGEG